jgi:hypothetical protein
LATYPEFGPMYGPEAVSEVTLARRLLGRLPPGSLVLADSNFGIFVFAYAACVQAGHEVLLRLTPARFESLRAKAQPVGPGCWKVTWRPSRYERRKHPELPAAAEVQGWLHEVRISEELTLWLFTTLSETGAEVAAVYGQRWNVETDIGSLKQTLDLEGIRGRSINIVEKELLAAVVAYNLTNQVRRLAATRLQIEPRRLSFAGVWHLLKAFMGAILRVQSVEELEMRFELLLRAAGQRKLPRRAPNRRYPRQVIPRRRKFQDRKPIKPNPSP